MTSIAGRDSGSRSRSDGWFANENGRRHGRSSDSGGSCGDSGHGNISNRLRRGHNHWYSVAGRDNRIRSRSDGRCADGNGKRRSGSSDSGSDGRRNSGRGGGSD